MKPHMHPMRQSPLRLAILNGFIGLESIDLLDCHKNAAGTDSKALTMKIGSDSKITDDRRDAREVHSIVEEQVLSLP